MLGDTRRRVVADRLNHLFAMVLKRLDGSGQGLPAAGHARYSDEDVAGDVGAQVGAVVAPTIRQLRAGGADLPDPVRDALAGFFCVPGSYFDDDVVAETIDHDLRFLAAVRDSGLPGEFVGGGNRFGGSLSEPTRAALMEALIEFLAATAAG